MKNFDCGFTRENNRFRYRAAAIIVEDKHVLFAGNELDDYYYSIGGAVHIYLYFLMKARGTMELHSNSITQGVKENMYWLPIEDLDKYRAFPSFMKDYLSREHNGIEHIVSDERKN